LEKEENERKFKVCLKIIRKIGKTARERAAT
jgi:hypothetical protein